MRLFAFFCVVILCVVPVGFLFSDEIPPEGAKIEMEAEVTGTYPTISGNKAKHNEYRDVKDGVVGAYGSLLFDYDSRKGYFLNFNALDIGYDTQSYTLEGGKWGSFRYLLYYNEIPHNITWDALTPYYGAGSDNLTYFGAGRPSTNTNTWLPFDYSTIRKDYGAGIRVDRLKPFYAEVSFSHEKKEGIKPFAAEGASGFGNAIELPEPVDYRTNQLKGELGYAKQPFFMSLQYFYSQFSNNDEVLSFRNPFLTTQPNVDRFGLAPDNTYQKLSFTGNVKLPMNSKFNTNLGHSTAKSDVNILGSIWNNDALQPLILSTPRFHGDVKTQNYDFVLTSNPVRFVEGKAFYKYYRRDNDSDTVISVNEDNQVTVNQLFGYKKETFGAQLDFRLYRGLHLLTSYQYIDLDRKRYDIPRNEDNIYFAELRYSPMSFGVFRISYEKMLRSADVLFPDPTGSNAIELYQRRYDAAAQDRDTFKTSWSITPIDPLNVDISYKYRKSNYDDTIIGLLTKESNEFAFDANYTLGKYLQLFGYFDYQKVKTNQLQRQYDSNPNPYGGLQDGSNFNWTSKQRDSTYDYGLGMDIHVLPKKLTFRFSYDYMMANGDNDFTYLAAAALTGGRNNENMDISNWGDYRKEYFMVKTIYQTSPSLGVTAGYVYERYKSSDAQYNGYRYTVSSPASPPNTYLTGAYKDQEYRASIVFLGVSYTFK
jgi:MtrB/PioB family decaheme-associated outer membrane protein